MQVAWTSALLRPQSKFMPQALPRSSVYKQALIRIYPHTWKEVNMTSQSHTRHLSSQPRLVTPNDETMPCVVRLPKSKSTVINFWYLL